MAFMDLAQLTAPIDDDEPCGPDLEAEDDDAFVNFTATSAMMLPDQYFVEDHEGNRRPFYTDERFKELNLNNILAPGAKLVVRTHDLRLLCLIAKIQIFNRNLSDFQVSVEAIAVLLETYWDAVHPGLASGLRGIVLEQLNEQYSFITALNNAPLFRSRRYGALTWQSYLAAVREASGGRDDGDTAAIDRVLIDDYKADPAAVEAIQGIIGRLGQALARIKALWAEKLAAGPPDLQRLSDTVGRIRAMLERVNPSAQAQNEAPAEGEAPASAGGEALAPGGVPAFETTEAAVQGLAVATRYLADTEPSSPALLLLRQAQALVGKSFLDALEALLPDQVSRATLSAAPLPVFDLPLRQLAERGLAPEDAPSFEDDAAAAEAAPLPPVAPRPRVGSRAEALALLDRVASHYRIAEPSSPIPLLIERARGLVGKDFLSLLRTMLSDAVLRGE